ncbi:hypothetical protein PQX77_006949 [Marasmius sp. AFHP31]|nr:hypothetical protein PQX77_006949 [Marasmius sp. AFHP31]
MTSLDLESVTPTRRTQVPSTNSPDVHDTPSNRMCIVTSNLAATSSGSFLTSRNLYTSDTPYPRTLDQMPVDLPQPDWSLTKTSSDPSDYPSKEEMGGKIAKLTQSLGLSKAHMDVMQKNQEVYAAQAVLQDIALVKMNHAVKEKEEDQISKKKRSEYLFTDPGVGRVWTSNDVQEKMRQRNADRAREENEAAEKAKNREERKRKKAEAEEGWKNFIAEHREAVAEHGRHCQALREQGVQVKDLPHKPKKAMTKKEFITSILGTADAEDASSEEDGWGTD